ncbi:hypothetical protein FSARC_4194 [Fusarium sarcochroum]|uniref:F-box domain-containing protein n=1 Tax=Fusarium sarcochroum TaxID=1208366 RepID=A0A8H4U2C8_9HYPO|nr:hypothetical protein FSARC_4194 [Fusarium sarcochroum]
MPNLPDEIWLYIFVQLEDYMPLKDWITYGSELKHEGPAALRNVSLVCRRFQRIAQPLLYRTILLEGRDAEETHQTLLLRTIVENPQFGEQVRIASFDDNTGYTWDITEGLVEGGVRSLLLKGLGTLDLPPAVAEHQRKCVYSRYEASFAALIVAYMPQLQFLDYTLWGDKGPLPWMLSGSLGLEEKILQNLEIDSHVDDGSMDHEDNDEDGKQQLQSIPKDTFANYGLPHLTEVRIRTRNSLNGSTPAWVIEPILLNPTLKTLRTLGIDWSTGEIEHLKWPNHETNLEHLDLKESIIDAAGLKSVLTHCPKLKGVSIELAEVNRECQPGQDWEVDLDHFRDVLQKYGRGLEEFDLLTVEYSSNHSVGGGRLGPLRELSKLRHLKVIKAELLDDMALSREERHLTLGEALPLSLETLYLHCDGRFSGGESYKVKRRSMNEAVYDFILENKLPNLREIKIERLCNESGRRGIEWPVEFKMDGWEVDVYDENLWKRFYDSGVMRTIVRLSRKL